MTKLFLDTEFTGLHQNTTLISIALVSDDGNTFYAEMEDYDKRQVDDWLQTNVINNLILDNYDFVKDYQPEENNVIAKCTFRELKAVLSDWLSRFKEVEIWSDCLSYDWMLFCEIWGGALKIPKHIYYIPFDICPLFLEKTGNADVNREKYAGTFEQSKETLKGEVKKHNAYWDAHIIKACYHRLMANEESPTVTEIWQKSVQAPLPHTHQ